VRNLLPFLAFFAVLAASPALANLSEQDLFAMGDGLLTRDSTSGLEWLDLTETTDLSSDDILADVGGWIGLGFRHATTAEVCTIMVRLGLAPSLCPGTSGFVLGNHVQQHMDLMGLTVTIPGAESGSGHYEDANSGNTQVGGATYGLSFGNSLVFVLEDNLDPTVADPYVGHFLVRSFGPGVPGLPPWGAALLGALLLASAWVALGRPRRPQTS
jgi:hypothetical protein